MRAQVFESIVGGEPVASATQIAITSPFAPTSGAAGAAASPVGVVAVASAQVVELALQRGVAAEAVAPVWPLWQRREVLLRLGERIAAEAEPLAAGICAEAGKPIDLARAEVARTLATLEATLAALGDGVVALEAGIAAHGAGRTALVRRFPRGLTTAITPFNFPLNLAMHKLAPAIAVGCPILLKPSPRAPLSCFHLANLALEAGLPPALLSCILPELADLDPLVSDPRVKVVSFTGSAEVGWALKARAQRQHVVLELGGNAAAVVCPDADLDAAVAAVARGAFSYAGQSCISVQRVFVDAPRLEAFLARLVAASAAFPCGDPRLAGVRCGPVIAADAADRIERWLDAWAAAGEPIPLRGRRDGNLLRPSVVQFSLTSDQPLISEEVFGPVVAVSGYPDLTRAFAAVNASRFGLQAGVFTDHLPTLQLAFQTLQVGAIIHNDVPTLRLDHLPYGGVKDSGLGLEGPRWAMEELTVPRLLAVVM